MRSDELQLRDPKERPLFWAFAVLNVLVMGATILIVLKGSDWLSAHPRLAEHRSSIRALAIAAVFGVPATTFLRNTRHALVRGKSIAISPQQLPQIYAILRGHCERLGIDPLPELYFSNMNMTKPARAYTSWKCEYIVLSSKFLQPNLQPMLPVFAFWLGCTIGCLRLKHANFPAELLLSFVHKIPHLANPLRRVFTYSEDRYGAFLAPEGLPGLIGAASGRRMLPELNTFDYLKQVSTYGGIWARFAEITESEPTISNRIKALLEAGLLKTELLYGLEDQSSRPS